MKPARTFYVRNPHRTSMRELEAGDRPRDYEGRELPFVPGDFYVEDPFQRYVLSAEMVQALYKEAIDGEAGDDRSDR